MMEWVLGLVVIGFVICLAAILLALFAGIAISVWQDIVRDWRGRR